MIYLIYKDNGGEYDSYQEYVESVWQLEGTVGVALLHEKFLAEKIQATGVVLEKIFFDDTAYIKNILGCIKSDKDRKTAKKILKENPIEKFLVEELRAERLEFIEIGDYNGR